MSPTKPKRPSDSQKPKLRASCDSCYLTKIKCNKARPMCSRCLTYGTDCNYSPSSRSGRTKRDSESDKTGNGSNPSPSIRVQEYNNGGMYPTPTPAFLHVPPSHSLDNESLCNFNTLLWGPNLGQSFEPYVHFKKESVDSREIILAAGSSMEPSECPWPSATEVSYNFDENSLLPLTSELLFSSPSMSWSQLSDGHLDFMSPITSGMPSYSPRTGISAIIPHNCNCLASYQDPQIIHNHSCPKYCQDAELSRCFS